MRHGRTLSLLVAAALSGGANAAVAQDATPNPFPEMGFLELDGSYGVQFGQTDYLPSDSFTDYRYPIVHGPAFGGTAGVMLDPGVALIASYEYTWATTLTGGVPGIIDSVQGTIDYHTAVVGARLYHRLGFGRLRGELAVGVLFPFHTQLDVQYGQGLGQLPTPITGTGTEVSNYSVGFGGTASIGYEIPIVAGLYAGLNLKYKLFETENSGETTQYTNFVTDYTATPPTAVTASVAHGDGAAQPSTYSVQDVRLQLALGGGF